MNSTRFERFAKHYEKNNTVPAILVHRDSYYETRYFKELFKSVKEPFIEKIDKNAPIQSIYIEDKKYMIIQSKVNLVKIYMFIVEDSEVSGTDTDICMGLIFIDNYDEVMESVEEFQRPLMLALVDRKINNFALEIDAVIKKFERDRFIIIFDESKLDKVRQSNFGILDEIREVEIGNKIPFTLSIGIGVNGHSLRQNMEYARAAIDLALGRGGDQALIKNGDEYEFFGGKTRETERNNVVRARVKAYALSELISESDKVIIMGHRKADLDCLGAAVGIYKIAKSYGKEAYIVLDEITTSINKLYDRLMEEPSYKNCFITGEKAESIMKSGSLLVVVDSHRPSILEHPILIEKSKKTVVIDHHRKGAEFIEDPVLTYHEPYASSTCELITLMLRYFTVKIELLEVEADALLAGITVDTKSYVIKTGTKTFEASAYLRRLGADTIRVRMLMQNDMESYKAKAIAVNNAKIYRKGIAIAICPETVENPELLAAQISDDLLNISEVEASFTIYFDHAGEQVHISARSLGRVNVQVIMEKMGGGGHQTAAATQIRNEDMEEVMDTLKKSIDEYMETL